MEYFEISQSEDGGVYVRKLNKELFLKGLTDDSQKPDFFKPGEPIPIDIHNGWGSKSLIIKGEVVCPQPKETIIVFSLD